MANQNSKWRVPAWALILIVAIIVLLLIKFCPGKRAVSDDVIDVIKKQHQADSIEFANNAKRYADTAEFYKQQRNYIIEKLDSATKHLNITIAENRRLITKYRSTNYNIVDSSAVLMPQEFVDDCKDCFTRLENTTDSIEQYKYQADALQVLYINQSKADSSRIEELIREKVQANRNYNDLVVANQSKATSETRKIKTGLAGMFDNVFMPRGVGPGIVYEDKKARTFGVKALFGNQQPVYIIDVHADLFVFRNKK